MEAVHALAIANSAEQVGYRLKLRAKDCEDKKIRAELELRATLMYDQRDLWYEVADYMKKRFADN